MAASEYVMECQSYLLARMASTFETIQRYCVDSKLLDRGFGMPGGDTLVDHLDPGILEGRNKLPRGATGGFNCLNSRRYYHVLVGLVVDIGKHGQDCEVDAKGALGIRPQLHLRL
jgi:hypothetical protein